MWGALYGVSILELKTRSNMRNTLKIIKLKQPQQDNLTSRHPRFFKLHNLPATAAAQVGAQKNTEEAFKFRWNLNALHFSCFFVFFVVNYKRAHSVARTLFCPLLLLLSTLVSGAYAQSPYQIHQKIAGDSLYLRWEPQNFAAFATVISTGLELEVYAVTGTATEPELRRLDRRQLRPQPYAAWRDNHHGSAWDTIAYELIHFEQQDAATLEEHFPFEAEEQTEANWRALRWTGTNYALNYDWRTIERAGFGYARPIDAAVPRYAVKLYTTGQPDTLWVGFDRRAYQPPAVPELLAEFRGRRVELSWRTIGHRRHFFGYSVRKSIDGGQTWTELMDLPLINDQDTLGVPALEFSYLTDTLAQADVEVRYRLHGHDYLGGRSTQFSEVTGSGYTDLRFSPLLVSAEPTDSNYAHLQWEWGAAQEALLREFRIVHTDSSGGIYRTALAGIDPSTREVWVPMRYEANFYRVQAVPLRGAIRSSFEALVMAHDAEPPATPEGLRGQIDSNGVVRLDWTANTEPDLAGYRVFRSDFRTSELAGITPDPLSVTTFVDTVDLRSGNEWVYYQLQAVDRRGNGSLFTPLLELKKPDTHPPAPPRIYRTESDDRSIELYWSASPAPDVVRYRLFRRRLEAEPDWGLVLTFTATDYRGSYRDTLVEPGYAYAYTLVATDDDGLDSDPAQPVSLRLKDYGLGAPISDLTILAIDGAALLNWSAYPTPPREYWLYRATADEPLTLLKALSGDRTEYRDTEIRPERKYRYVLRAVFAEGKLSPFSEELEFRLDGD